jgi:hypothetical protein
VADLRTWAAEWVTRLVEQGGGHGPGSRRTIAINDDSWHYLTDDSTIEHSLAELRSAAHRRPGRHAVTFERTMSGTRRLHVYAVEHRNDAPPERLHLALAFSQHGAARTQPVGTVTEFAEDSATYSTMHRDRSQSRTAVPSSVAAGNPRPATAPQPVLAGPQVRSAAEALGPARRYLDAALMAAFGIFCFVIAGASTTGKPALAVLIGLASLAYSGYIALSRGGYVMPYLIYGLAFLGIVYFIFG